MAAFGGVAAVLLLALSGRARPPGGSSSRRNALSSPSTSAHGCCRPPSTRWLTLAASSPRSERQSPAIGVGESADAVSYPGRDVHHDARGDLRGNGQP